MEATATRRDGSPGPSSSRWTYESHEQMGSYSYTINSISRSGTIVSTVYTSGASRSSLSTGLDLKINGDEHLSWDQRTKEEEMKRVIELVNGGVKGCFTELKVSLVLELHDDAFVREIQRNGRPWDWIGLHAPTWISALAEIVETIHFTQTHATPNQFILWRVTSKILQTVKSKLFFTNEIVKDDRASIPDQIQFARFAQAAMLKMLAFVDVLVAVDHRDVYRLYGLPEIHKLLNLLLIVHLALFNALIRLILVLRRCSLPGEVERILNEIIRLLSTKKKEALDAICLALNHTTIHLLKWIDDSSASQTLQQGSSDIHEITRSVISHISFLIDNKFSLDQIISGSIIALSETFPDQTHFDSMIIRMALRLQKKLVIMSETFPDQGLGFLFLLNNSHQLHQCLQSIEPVWSSLQLYDDFTKVDDYMESYLQVSWSPVLSCLFNPTKRVLGKNYSPLTRFESEIQKTCITQKHWKVPDPAFRNDLRIAIIQQIIPGYTKYIEENNITTPRLAPQELAEMLQDLFEG